MSEQSLSQLDFAALCDREFFASPSNWADQVLYFLMLDRYSDGKEKGYLGNNGQPVTTGSTPPFKPSDSGNAVRNDADAAKWREAGSKRVGGTLKGLGSKMGYLERLGINCVWISPVFKQVAFKDTYHGYGIQNFLDVDPHFGTRDDLRDVVATAHQHGIRVILDIILNHSGDVFAYDPDRYEVRNEATGGAFLDPRWDGNEYNVKGYKDASGAPDIPFGPVDLASHPGAFPDDAVWPTEFQPASTFTRKGRINNWDYDPEFREGDFFDLKDVHLGVGPIDDYHPSAALRSLCAAYKFWIAFADIDGFRVDTVKHMDAGAARFFTSVIHEFAQSIGKENFYLIGEITGGRGFAFSTLEATGMDSALGINDIPGRLEGLVKGYTNPSEYFDLFRNSLLVQKESHVWFRDKVVTVLDDHDQVRKGQQKARFCAEEPKGPKMMLAALALNATTLGIPCIYYGSEQSFDGEGGNDRYIREAMFGGEFGAFRSRKRHFFNEKTPVFQELAKVLDIRRKSIILRRGRQYLRAISGDGQNFGLPRVMGSPMRSIVAWSRIFNDREMLLAINSDPDQATTAWVVVDRSLNPTGAKLKCIYSTDGGEIGKTLTVEDSPAGAAVNLTVPAAGFVIYEQT